MYIGQETYQDSKMYPDQEAYPGWTWKQEIELHKQLKPLFQGKTGWAQTALMDRERKKAVEEIRKGKLKGTPHEEMGFIHTVVSAVLAIGGFLAMCYIFVEVFGVNS